METAYLTAMIMVLGIIVGSLISPRIQQKVGKEYNRKDLIFKKKLEYFEGIIETIEKNKRVYHNIILRLESPKTNAQVGKSIEELKKERKKFFVMASQLYFDTKVFSEKIVQFVKIEKEIFNKISRLKKANKKEKNEIIEGLKNDLGNLNKKGFEILYEMKKELAR